MRRLRAPRNARERGNSLLEFALISVVLMLLTVGVVDFGRVFALGNKAFNAAYAGTDWGRLSPAHYTDSAGMEAAATANLTGLAGATATATRTCYCSIGGSEVTCPASCVSGTPATYIKVSVDIPYQSLSRLPWLPGLTSIKGKSVVRVE